MELFISSAGELITEKDFIQTIIDVGAADCEYVFLHSDIAGFGRPGKDFSKKNILVSLYSALKLSGIKNLIVPAFTYSFCNGEDFDVKNSKTAMGALNEFIRKHPDRYRTADPLLSLSVPENCKDYFKKFEGNQSLGVGGALDSLHNLDNVKFLFLGADLSDCFTYVHYVEKIMDVPYRFDMAFTGNITGEDGIKYKHTQYIYTHCKGAELPARYDYFERELTYNGTLKTKRLGDKLISSISETDAYREIKQRLTDDINYFLKKPCQESSFVNEYTYDKSKGRITHC